MMDFRKTLYDRYVSTVTLSAPDAEPPRSFVVWRERKYLPLLAGLAPGSHILELGCGPGYMLKILRDHGYTNVKGIDISQEQIDLAVLRGCDAEVADVFEYLQGREETFDAIIAFDVIEHFHKEELLVLAELLYRALKSGGLFVLQTPNGEGLFPGHVIFGDVTHLTILNPLSLRQILAPAGFRNLSFHDTAPAPIGVKGRLRLGLWRLVTWVAGAIRFIETGESHTIWTQNMLARCEKPV
jgi:SAM-dependent methyltransferase